MPSVAIVSNGDLAGYPLGPRLHVLERAGWRADVVARPPRRRYDVVDLPVALADARVDGAALFVAESEALRAAAARNGLGSDRLAVVPPVATAPPAWEADGATLHLYSTEPHRWEAAYEDALVAVRLLLDRGVEVEYRLPAAGPFLAASEFARYQLGLEREVSFCGEPAGAVLLDTAVAPISPQGALDARAGGRPVAATGADGPALVVPKRNPEGVADGLGRLAGDPGLVQRLAGEGRAYAARFTAVAQARRYLEVYSAAACE